MYDVLSYMFCLIAFIIHLTGNDYHWPLVINPQYNDSHFKDYCPFDLSDEKYLYLVVAQARFHNFNLLFNSSFYKT